MLTFASPEGVRASWYREKTVRVCRLATASCDILLWSPLGKDLVWVDTG